MGLHMQVKRQIIVAAHFFHIVSNDPSKRIISLSKNLQLQNICSSMQDLSLSTRQEEYALINSNLVLKKKGLVRNISVHER